jgi:hypothetical protein
VAKLSSTTEPRSASNTTRGSATRSARRTLAPSHEREGDAPTAKTANRQPPIASRLTTLCSRMRCRMALRALTLALLVGAAAASPLPRARRLSHGRSHARDGTCAAAKQGVCLTGGAIAPFSGNTSSAAECCALCNKYSYVTTSVPTPCANWTYNTNNTIAPYQNCLLHPAKNAPIPYTNATYCTSGAPGPGPCGNNTDCNGGT